MHLDDAPESRARSIEASEDARIGASSVVSFTRFLKHAVHRQAGLQAGPVQFVPFGNTALVPWDAHALACVLLGRPVDTFPLPVRPMAGASAEEKASMLGRVAVTVLGWTVAWAACIQPLRQPWDASQERRLRRRLQAAWQNGRAVMNPLLASSRRWSVPPDASRQRADVKITALVATVRATMARAAMPACHAALAAGDLEGAMRVVCGPGLPFGGYLDKSARCLCRLLGIADSRGSDVLAMGSGAFRGLAHIHGGDALGHAGDPELVRALVLQTVRDVRRIWPRAGGPVVALPELLPWDICEMLCIWAGTGFQDAAVPRPRVMLGLGIPLDGQTPLQ